MKPFFRMRTIFVFAVFVVFTALTGCMGKPQDDFAPGFSGAPPINPLVGGPPGFAISSGGGVSSSTNIKAKARIGKIESSVVSSSSGMQLRTGIQGLNYTGN